MSDSDYILGAFREMTRSDLQGGLCEFTGAIPGVSFYCTVSVFDLENPLVAAGGGHTPRMLGTIEIAQEDFPEGTVFSLATGLLVDVTDGAGVLRHCKVDSWKNLGPLWQITVVDL